MKRVTINDVAQRAGVSKTTVSHVINKTRFVEERTRQKVLQAVEELDYHPSSIARSLTSRQTKTVALLVSDVANPFYPEVIRGVEEVALSEGYQIFFANTSYDLQRSFKLIHSLIEKQVDGVMYMSSSASLELIQELYRHDIPAVVMDWEVASIRQMAATITLDFKTGIDQAVQHLVSLGHRHIIHVSGPLDLWTAQKRRDLFTDALRSAGVVELNGQIIEGNLRVDGGSRAFRQIMNLPQMPTAVFAANDLTALGIIFAAREHGLRIPEDLSVIGLDDIELASTMTPQLTTVALPRFHIGKLAMETLLEMFRVSGETVSILPEFQKTVATGLIVRHTTAAPAQSRKSTKI